MSPDYTLIYSDIIEELFPHRRKEFENFLNKSSWSSMDVIKINSKIFGEANQLSNQKRRAYSKSDIKELLHHQKKNKINNSEMARQFKISRTSIAKWRKIYEI